MLLRLDRAAVTRRRGPPAKPARVRFWGRRGSQPGLAGAVASPEDVVGEIVLLVEVSVAVVYHRHVGTDDFRQFAVGLVISLSSVDSFVSIMESGVLSISGSSILRMVMSRKSRVSGRRAGGKWRWWRDV